MLVRSKLQRQLISSAYQAPQYVVSRTASWSEPSKVATTTTVVLIPEQQGLVATPKTSCYGHGSKIVAAGKSTRPKLDCVFVTTIASKISFQPGNEYRPRLNTKCGDPGSPPAELKLASLAHVSVESKWKQFLVLFLGMVHRSCGLLWPMSST